MHYVTFNDISSSALGRCQVASDRISKVEDTQKTEANYIDFMSFVLVLVNWLYVVTCKKCGYISSEKLPELKAKQMIRSHLGGLGNCTRGHIKLVKVRA